jgi:hypothetical protein
MRSLVPGLVACLVALPLTVLALVFVTSPASRDDNGVGLTPAMGWSSWSFLRDRPTEASVEAEAKAMKDSGVAGVGYQYVNLDDFWSTSVSALGMKAGRDYLLTDLWTHRRTQTTGTISAEVPSHGVALFRMSPLPNPASQI